MLTPFAFPLVIGIDRNAGRVLQMSTVPLMQAAHACAVIENDVLDGCRGVFYRKKRIPVIVNFDMMLYASRRYIK